MTARLHPTVQTGPVGPQGPPGPQGDPGPGAGAYRHIQNIAAAIWTITHNLGYYPNITVVDSSGSEVIGNVEYLTGATVRVTFSAAFAGEAYLT